MGTSTRRINKKIKEILEQKNPETFDQVIPDVYKEVMRVRSVNRFYSDEFTIAIGAGIRGINAINNGTFRDEYNFTGTIDNDPLTKQKIIETILDLLEEGTFEDESPVKTALKYALTEAVRQATGQDQLRLFVEEFCYCLIYLLLSGQSAEVLGEFFVTLSPTELDEKIKEVARGIVANSLKPHIANYISGAITLETLISTITETVASLKVGDL